VKELEVAMAEGRADLAVHSLKDVPMELPEGFALTAVMEREDPRDALVSAQFASLDEMPAGTVVGTSSLRREAALRSRFPHLVIKPLREIWTRAWASWTVASTAPSFWLRPGSSDWAWAIASAR
jgi:hydroxymethylbilane synthase